MYPHQQPLPDSTVRPVYITYLEEWLDKLGAYDGSEGRDQDLELYRKLWESDAYYPLLYPFPNNIVGTGAGVGPGNRLNFDAGETQTGTLQVPAMSYMVSIGAYSSSGAGFMMRVYEKGTQCDMVYQNFGFSQMIGSQGDQDPIYVADRAAAPTSVYPFGPYILRSPLIVLPPGVIQIEMTNLDNSSAATMQALFSFAVPKGSVSTNVVQQEEN